MPGRPPLWATTLLGVVCGLAALAVAHRWAATGEPTGAYVTDCAVWFPDADLHRCDYHWTAAGERFSGRFPGGDWPDGHRTRIWLDPDDPAHADPGKNVVPAIVAFAVFGLVLAAAAVRLAEATKDGATLRGRFRRTGVAAVAVAVAAFPAGAIVSRAVRQPDRIPVSAAPAQRAPVLRGVEPCPEEMEQHDRASVSETSIRTRTSVVRLYRPAGDVTMTVSGIASSASLSPDGTVLATGETGGSVRLWDVATRRATAMIVDDGWVDSVAFDTSGRTLAVAEDRVVRLWDVASLRAPITLFGQGPGRYKVGFAPDGTTLDVCEGDAVRRWDLT
jgi:hypothetical protein